MLEEYTYRALNIRILLSSGMSSFWAVVIAPLAFGVSHLHFLFNSKKNSADFKRQVNIRRKLS